MNNTDPAKTISPKVIASAAGAIIGAGLVAGISALTPEHFASLGIWGSVVFAAVAAAGSAIAGYLVRDPLRR